MENLQQNTTLAKLVITTSLLALLLLTMLHILSPEFSPAWRMVSEYALGSHQWALTLFFLFWGLSSICLGVLLWRELKTIWGKTGVVFLFLSGIGTMLAAAYDVEHSLHGLAAAMGIPTLIIAALLISYQLGKKEDWKPEKKLLLLSAHFTWISLALMFIAMMVMMTGFTNAGIAYSENSAPPESVPDGVIALAGFTNRLLIVAYIAWLIITARIYIKLHNHSEAYDSDLLNKVNKVL